MKKVLFLFAAAAIACSARAAETPLATFEASANDILNTTGGQSSVTVVANPLKAGINTTDSCLLNIRSEGQGWNVLGHLYNGNGDSVVISDANRYLHFMVYSPSNTSSGKIIVRTSSVAITDENGNLTYGEDGDHQIQFDTPSAWTDVALDLQGFGNALYAIYFLSQDWGGTPAEGRTFYYDEIVLSSISTPRGAITAAATLGDFEATGVTPAYMIEAGVLTALEVANNPDKTGINASDSALHGHTISASGDWWGGLRITPAGGVEVNNSTRYLHVMMYTNLPVYEFDLFSSKGEDWMGKTTDNTNINTWFDHVVDLYSKDLEGKTLNSFRISVGVDASAEQRDKDLYIDEIVVNGESSPRVPTVSISISPSNLILMLGDTLQFTADVKLLYGATTDEITWSVTGGTGQTGISATGLLTIAADETAATLTVTATAVYDAEQKASVTLKIGRAVTGESLASFEASAGDALDDVNGTWSPLDVVDNPDKTGINTSDKCLLNTRENGWTDGGHISSSNGDFAIGGVGRYLHIMVYSPEVVSGMLFVQHTNYDSQWDNDASEIRWDFQQAKWKDIVMDLKNYNTVYGLYFLSQDWGGTSTTRYFYYDEIVVNDDPTPRGETLVSEAATLVDFESVVPEYLIEGSAFSTLDVVDNPNKTGINATDKALYGLTSTAGDDWGGAKIQLGNVLINDNTRYLHVQMRTTLPEFELRVFSIAGEIGEKRAGVEANSNFSSWFDYVVDLYNVREESYKDGVVTAIRVVANVTVEANCEKDLYIDQISVSDDPTPLAPSVVINSITPASPSVAKGATQQFTADVATTYGADAAVTWSVSGGVNMTGITAAGLLSVATGETAATLTVTATSVFDNTKSASVTVTVTDASATAVEKTQSATLSAYPNPTTGVVYVENDGNSEVVVYSVKGELLLRTVGSSVDLSALPSGVYVIKVGGKAARVVKQ
jgi:uncharacterized protein YjdB